MYGAMTMSVLMLIFMTLQLVPQAESISWASIGINFVFLFVFGYAWQGCVWLYCSEIAPLEYRHIGGAFTACGTSTLILLSSLLTMQQANGS